MSSFQEDKKTCIKYTLPWYIVLYILHIALCASIYKLLAYDFALWTNILIIQVRFKLLDTCFYD